MAQDQSRSDQYEVIIVECCENCQTHQSFSRHSEWKYFQQFNQLKRKLERFVSNTIVVKNPIPDQLIKPIEGRLPANTYLNKQTNEQVVFPRIGSFQIYIYNILIYSKLLTNSWPNHYKMIQTVTKIIQQKKKGNSLHEFSVFQQPLPFQQKLQKQVQKPSVSKKKKKDYRVYKSKDKSILHQNSAKKPGNLDPIQSIVKKKAGRRTLLQKEKQQLRNTETKIQNRIKLPSLRNTISFNQQQQQNQQRQQGDQLYKTSQKSKLRYKKSKQKQSMQEKQQSLKKIFNSIEQFQNSDASIMRRNSISGDEANLNGLILQRNQSIDMKSLEGEEEEEQMKMLEDRSVQYSQKGETKDFMNRQIQYEQQEGFYCDYGLQIDDGTRPKQKNSHYVQTQKYQPPQQVQAPKKPYMLDQQVQANIILKKDQKQAQAQTQSKQTTHMETNTEMKAIINRMTQFPEQESKPLPRNDFDVIDSAFTHLFQKRRNLYDNKWYSIDKFEEKATRYKWIGRASEKVELQDIRKSFLYQCLVFCFYNYFGIKTPQKRLSLQACSNVIVDQKNTKLTKTALIHTMTADNPEIQLMDQFEQFEQYGDGKLRFPLSQILTFRNSKQTIKFTNYGGLLALAYFVGDMELFSRERSYLGIVVSNQEVKEIYKLSADGYRPFSSQSLAKNKINVIPKSQSLQSLQSSPPLLLQRTSQQIEKQFISGLSKIVDQQVFTQLLRYFEQTFVHLSPSHKIFRNALLSMKTEKVDENIVNGFIDMLKDRRDAVLAMYRGEIYSYNKYKSLRPKIGFNLFTFTRKIEPGVSLAQKELKQSLIISRRFLYNQKIVTESQVEKHIRSKDTFVIIQGESGIGKTTFIQSISTNLDQKFADKLRIRQITKQDLNNQGLLKKRVDQILDQYRKQVIIIDDAQSYQSQTISLIQKIYNKQDPRTRPELSFCLATTDESSKLRIRLNTLKIQIVHCWVMPLEIQEIRNWLMKGIQYHNYTDKKNFSDDILGADNVVLTDAHPKYQFIRILRNPFYLSIYTHYLCKIESLSDTSSTLLTNFSRYSILKQINTICTNKHLKQCKQTQINFQDCLYDLRRIAFQYYINNYAINEIIREIIGKHQSSQIIANQLAFYPVNLEAVVKADKDIFAHKEYFYYYLAEAYCFYMQKSFRNMHMNKVYSNTQLLSLIRQHYNTQKTHSKLLQVVQKSKKYKSTWQQSSNAITLLNKISFIFSNYNFDQVQIPQADLTEGVFYNCTFRGANLNNTILYKVQMISCMVDGAIVDNINLYHRKYEIEYTVLTAALSIDGRNIALGCGNFLIILQTDSGKQLKKIQAHVDIIRSVKYSKDNTTLITIADDKTLRMWDTRSFRSVVFKLPQKGTIAFSSETDMIASVIKSTLKVWNIKSMANQFVLEGHSDLITCLEFSNDGNYIATGSRDNTVRIWSTKKGELVKTFKGHSSEVITLKISPLKRIVVSSSKDKDIIVWGFDSAAQISKKKFADQITQICLDQKQKFVAVSLSKQNYILILHLETLHTVHTLDGHKGKIISLNFDVNFRRLISLGKDKTVKIWDLDKIMQHEQKKYLIQKQKSLKIASGPILSMAFDKQSNRYITAHQNGQINIFSAADNRHVDQLVSHNGAVNRVQVDKTGKIYAAGSDGSVRIWNLSARREPRVLDLHSSSIIQMKLNQRNRIIATSAITQELVIVDFTGINIIMSTREEGKVQAIQFNKEEKIMAVGGSEKYIAIYNIGEGGNSINRLQQLGPNSDNVACMIFQGDAYLVAALKNGQITIWNHLRSTLAKKIENTSLVTSIINFQKKYVCFSSQDGKLRVVDMDEGKQIKIFRVNQKCTSILTNSNQSFLYESTSQGNIIIWNLGSLKQKSTKVQFDRIAFDQQGLKVVQIQGPRDLLIRDLHFHQQQVLTVKQLNSDIQGVTYYRQKIILLLKNGLHWQLAKNKQFSFGSEQNIQGDLYWMREKRYSTFFKTAVKKLRGIKKPILAVLQDLSY